MANRPLTSMYVQHLRKMMNDVCKVSNNIAPVYMENLVNKPKVHCRSVLQPLEKSSLNTATYVNLYVIFGLLIRPTLSKILFEEG